MSSQELMHSSNGGSTSGQITECSICMEILKSPKGLPCLHTFCLECLRKYGADKTPGDELPCPLCRQLFYIPKAGFEKLPTNFFIQELLEGAFLKHVAQENQLECEMCDDRNKSDLSAIKYCIECDQKMCERCAGTHGKVRFARSHKVVSAEDRQGIGASITSRLHYCESHEDQPMKLYCNDCKKPICLMCKAVNHDGHPCTEIKEAAQSFTEKIKHMLSGIREQVEAVQQEIKNQSENRNDLLQQLNKTEGLILSAHASLIGLINKQRDELIDKLDTFKEERLKEMETRKDEIQRQYVILNNLKVYAEKLIEHGSMYEISRSSEDLLARAKDLPKLLQEAFDVGQLTKTHVAFTPGCIADIKTGSIGYLVFNTEKVKKEDELSISDYCRQQVEEMKLLCGTSLRVGHTWYLLNVNWYQQWKQYVGYDLHERSLLRYFIMIGNTSAKPGPIDNTPLLTHRSELKPHLVEDTHYSLLPEVSWNKLVEWYGLKDSQQTIARKVIDFGVVHKNLKVEVYLLELVLCQAKDLNSSVMRSFSHGDAINTIAEAMLRVFDIDRHKPVRLWHNINKSYKKLENMTMTIQEQGLHPKQVVVIEEMNNDGSWPFEQKLCQQK